MKAGFAAKHQKTSRLSAGFRSDESDTGPSVTGEQASATIKAFTNERMSVP